jgi:hypothetical protein
MVLGIKKPPFSHRDGGFQCLSTVLGSDAGNSSDTPRFQSGQFHIVGGVNALADLCRHLPFLPHQHRLPFIARGQRRCFGRVDKLNLIN